MQRANFSLFWSIFIISVGFVTIFGYFGQLRQKESNSKNIAIVIIITNTTSTADYDVALKSVECYAKIQGYKFLLIVDTDYKHVCHQNHKFFLRHCVISHLLPTYGTILFLDADHGVVNPKRRIEEFLDPQFDVTFYDRFFDWEVMAGSYLVRNSAFSVQFLQDWANFENNMSRVTHGTDNSALHLVLADHLFKDAPEQVNLCRGAYYGATSTQDISTYIACIRNVFGSRTDFGHVRIMKKGTGWSRDDWLTSGVWNSRRDFMLHGWKTKNMRPVPEGGVLEPIPMNYAHFYNPLAGPIDLERCHPGNSTWSYNHNLLGDWREIEKRLLEYSRKIEREKAKTISRMKEILERS